METFNAQITKKIRFLAGLVVVLALVYTGTLIFEPERVNTRNASFVWLDAKWQDQADRIEISQASQENTLSLTRQNNTWFVSRDGVEYPAKQARIDDFLRILTTRGSYPVRGAEAASHERLGLTENTASRVIIRGGTSTYPLLDLLIGNEDLTGSEIYLRKNNQNEVRSGQNTFSPYISGPVTAWLNLRLFPAADLVEEVQRLTVLAPAKALEEAPGSPLILARQAGAWTIDGNAAINTQRIESYIRSILDAEGEDFIPTLKPVDPVFNEGRIVLEFGNGTTRTISLGPSLESNQRSATVSEGAFVYALAEWTVERIFRDRTYFEQQ
ncbi:MAG: DUF4340 domain-containing protein [Treponema sp.]|nr:DUF4340 domain-containing protein [Treponema sp.]